MFRFIRVLAPLLASFLWGCASITPPDPVLLAQIDDFELVQQRQDAFLALPDALARLQDMQSYATEVAVLYDTESLRLGPLGSALIAKYDASLNGHLVLQKFYRPLHDAATAKHVDWVRKITNHAAHGRDGSLQQPFRALTIEDAHAFILNRGESVIGSTYGQSEEFPLIAYLLARDASEYVKKVYFEIQAYPRWRELTPDPANAHTVDVIRALARARDNSAQVAYGIYLLENANSDPTKRDRIIATGRNWLRNANATPNAMPPFFLANFEVAQRAKGISWDRVKANYERAIQLGYTDAHVRLGKLYLQGVFGSPERRIGLELLEEAVELNNVEAASALGSLLMSQAPDEAIEYFHKAAELGGRRHKLTYVRTILQPSHERALSETEFNWIADLANEENQEAMVLLGNIYAKGLYDSKVSIRQARKWYRRSVEIRPNDGQHVNEVAWVLATTHLKRLRNPTLAIQYMDTLMTSNEQARNLPAYIDTWAAAYAAAGDFRRAIELQQEAVALAEQRQEGNVKAVLESHLRDYKDRKALTEKVP